MIRPTHQPTWSGHPSCTAPRQARPQQPRPRPAPASMQAFARLTGPAALRTDADQVRTRAGHGVDFTPKPRGDPYFFGGGIRGGSPLRRTDRPPFEVYVKPGPALPPVPSPGAFTTGSSGARKRQAVTPPGPC